MKLELKRRVRKRAGGRCEYCHIPEKLDVLPFQIDHIIARQHSGRSHSQNLALACAYCNGYKGTNLAGIDPRTHQIVRLFHPRRDQWDEHFRWSGGDLLGLTPIGRATVSVLRINAPINIWVRESLLAEGVSLS